MNKQRRKSLKDLIEQLQEIRCELEYLFDEEQSAYDNMPESLQDSERGEAMSEGLDVLIEAYETLDDLIEQLACQFNLWV